jgi:transposase
MMAGNELFGELPEQAKPQAEAAPLGGLRLREPQRDQIALRAVDIESLVGEDHPVRVIWSYVEGLDLSELENRIKARGEQPGRPATSPRLLLALWLYATSEGVGSARGLERLCEGHDAYRWLCGGVSVNYHMLADFRVGCADLLDRLLSEHLAALAKAGLVDLKTLAQDGVRVRASAGAASFRREATLDRHLALAEAVVEDLKREVEARSDASHQRARAARERPARERSERVKAAQTALAEIKQQREEREEKRGNGKKPKEPRASTTDADARVMKMADGGFRPAYNVQVTSVAGEQFVTDVKVCNTGSDRGLMRPMLERQRTRPGGLCPKAISSMAALAAPRTSNGRMPRGSRCFVRPLNPGMARIRTCRGAATARGCWPGVRGWRAKRARPATSLVRFASASMPAGATGTCGY